MNSVKTIDDGNSGTTTPPKVNVNGLTGDMSFPKLNVAVKWWGGGLGYMNHPLEDGDASPGWQAMKDTGSSDTMYTATRELYECARARKKNRPAKVSCGTTMSRCALKN